jgi:SNF2 family DNA or RNA helicase
MLTVHQNKYMAWELTKRHSSSDEDKFTGVLSEAKVDLNPHQIEAALFAFRSPLSMGAILADEVGLGKTIEAALVISQHWAERKRHILIISPATLRKQWNIELEDKFYLPSIILERKNFNKTLNDTYSNPFDTTDGVIICSYPFARKQIDHINRVKWDLVVIDEAHSLRNVYKNNKTGTALKYGLQPFKKILLTATPLQNDIKELYGLISIIDNNYFGGLDSFSSQYNKVALREDNTYVELRNRIQPVVHRTLRSQVQAYVKYTNRIPLVQEYTPSSDEIELSNRINEYLHKEECYGMPRSQRNLITLVLYKLLASSSFAIAGTLSTIVARLQKIVDNHSSENESEQYNYDDELVEDYVDSWLDEEDEEEQDEKEENVYTDADIENIKKEIDELKEIHQLALSIATNSKGECLIQALGYGFMNMEDMGAPHKALIFTESTRTQQYLLELLESNGYQGKIVLFNGSNNDPKSKEIYSDWGEKNKNTSRITGSRTADKRQALVDYFRDQAEIMIATEAAAEGINLQFCSLIVNYDLPWNPQRVEQRIGRCHRYGQKHDVVVVNFINVENRADKRVYEF